LARSGKFDTNIKAAAQGHACGAAPVMRTLPPTKQWASVHSYGAVGDGQTDDTVAVQKTIDANRVVYLPLGFYLVSDSIRMKPDTVLIGLHPGVTQLVLPNGSPAYVGVDGPKALLESAKGGDAIVTGFGLATGEVNPRAVALLWKAGADSLVDDIRIQGGHGTRLYDGKRRDPYQKTANFDPTAHWDRQYPSIWVTDGGGGTFVAVWTPSTFAQAGFYVSNTKTPGKVYELSAEHHIRAEIVLDNVENWEFLAPQTEQEVRDGMDAVSLEIRNSRNLLFANYHAYRVTRSIKPAVSAVKLTNSSDIRFRNVHVNAESGYADLRRQWLRYLSARQQVPVRERMQDVTHKQEVREREFAVLDIGSTPPAALPAPAHRVKVQAGRRLLLDRRRSVSTPRASCISSTAASTASTAGPKIGAGVVRDAPLDPVNLAIDKSGALMVVSSHGS
jgi:hypothetical protein